MSRHDHNFQRDTSPLMTKLKSLQKLHREALAHKNKSGNFPASSMFFSEMEGLYGSCGIESRMEPLIGAGMGARMEHGSKALI